MASWNALPLELKHEIMSYVVQAADDWHLLEDFFTERNSWDFRNDFGTFEEQQCALFVRTIEGCLLVSKDFSKTMVLPLERYLRDLRVYRNDILEKVIRAKKEELNKRWWAPPGSVANAALDNQVECYHAWRDVMYERRNYVLRALQHVRGRPLASWQSLPRELRIKILGLVLPDMSGSFLKRRGQVTAIVTTNRSPEQSKQIEMLESALIMIGFPSEEASKEALRVVMCRAILTHFRDVRKQFNALHFISREFSGNAAAAILGKVQHLLRARDSIRSNGHLDHVTSEWTREVKRLDDFVDSFSRSLEDRGYYELDEDEFIDWSSQAWWLKGRPKLL